MLEQVTKTILEWKTEVTKDIPLNEIYLVGSLVHRKGGLFDKNSDVDMVVIIPDEIQDAVQRTKWLEIFRQKKKDLELRFISLLQREQTTKPIVSVLPITSYELNCDLHKDKKRSFFSDNRFYDVVAGKQLEFLIAPESIIKVDETIREVMEFSQNVRNKYNAVSFVQLNDPMAWDVPEQALPKELVRTTALVAYMETGDKVYKTDIHVGATKFSSYIHSRRADDELYDKLDIWCSIRLQQKDKPALESKYYLFFSEIIFDMAQAVMSNKMPVPGKKNVDTVDTAEATQPENVTTSLRAEFVISKNGQIAGSEREILKAIENAGVNLAWRTEPYFTIEFEESPALIKALERDPDNGSKTDRLRKLENILRPLLMRGFSWIIYYQRPFFNDARLFQPESSDIQECVMTALKYYCLWQHASVFNKSNSKNIPGGMFEAFPYDYQSFHDLYPSVNDFSPVIGMTFPNVTKAYEWVGVGQPLREVKRLVLAQFFIPTLADRLARSNVSIYPSTDEHRRFVDYVTNIQAWRVGVH